MDFCRDAARAAIEITGVEAMSRELVEKHEALTQMHDIARKALEGSASDRAV
jgi:hypothetical protein